MNHCAAAPTAGRHLAFDLGLTTTGVAAVGHYDHHTCPAALRRSPMTDERRQARLGWWRDTFHALIWTGATVVVEAPFLSRSHPSGAVELLKLHGVLAAVCCDKRARLTPIENRSLKKWATGNGNATKDDMVAAARHRGFTGTDHNAADAYLLWSYWADNEGRGE